MALTVKQVDKLVRDAAPGLTSDGDGLYLKIGETGAASWAFRYQIAGKRRIMGLGAVSAVTLAEARHKAAEARKLVKQGIDPLEARKAEENAAKGSATTFRDVAQQYIASKQPGWQARETLTAWTGSLRRYVYPKFGDKPIAEVSTEDVLEALTPIWQKKNATADKVRNRIELVIDAARALGLRTAPNPAVWRGHMSNLLAKRPAGGNLAAMDYRDVPAFFERLRQMTEPPAIALQFTILTAARTDEVRFATWDEFDMEARIWNVPASHMKNRKPHRIPLSDEAVALLDGIDHRDGPPFRYRFENRPMSKDAMLRLLQRDLGHPDLTVHGFRSSFRDWCAEETHYPNIVAEQALAHTVGNAVEAAYRRGDLLDKRRALMADWATYCATKPAANVIPLRNSA